MIKLPLEVIYILDQLKANGYEGFVVGGCIRDVLMNSIPKDWDISTDAKPKRVKEIFKDTIDIGEQYGTIGVKIGHVLYEVTTYRCNEEYEDNRRPSKLIFSNCIEDDLSRRDFTINAMAYNKERGLIDLHEGLKDLKSKKIVCVGQPFNRLEEDALRIMRGIRFAVCFQFEIEDYTKQAMKETNRYLNNISIERISDEFSKILLSKKPSYGIDLMNDTGVLGRIIPEFTAESEKNKLLDQSIACLPIRLALLYYDLNGSDMDEGEERARNCGVQAKKTMKRFRYATKIIDLVVLMISENMNSRNYQKLDIKKLVKKIGLENMELFIAFMEALPKKNTALDLKNLKDLKEAYRQILKNKEPLEIRDLEIKGNDLLEIGFLRGERIGFVLNKLLEAVYEYPEKNQKEVLKIMAKQFL